MESRFGADSRRPGTPPFASFAALRGGIGREREYAEWCGRVADAREQAATDAGGPRAPV